MKNTQCRIPLVLWLLTGLLVTSTLFAGEDIVKYEGENTGLLPRWEWAMKQAQKHDVYWIGYQFERRMSEMTFIGTWSSDSNENDVTLDELLGQTPLNNPQDESLYDAARKALKEAKTRHEGRKLDRPIVTKRLAVLMRMQRHAGVYELAEVEISNTSLVVDLEGKPLYWLGQASQEESRELIKQRYDAGASNNVRENLVMALGMHTALTSLLPDLTAVVKNDPSIGVQETAVFWIGQQDTEPALRELSAILNSDAPRDLREKAVFGLSQMSLEPALNMLIEVARNDRDRDIRENAIFWLGQNASEKTVQTLENIVNDPAESAVKEQAVFAISQLPQEIAVPKLIELAKDHPDARVRKKAIFWLGESEDPRALEALVKLAGAK